MTTSSKTATGKQGTMIIGIVVLFAVMLAVTVLPTFKPRQSKLVGLPAAGFSLPVVTGGEPGSRMRLGDLRGKVVLIDFWASWCAPCRAEAPIIDAVARRYDGKGLIVMGIATSDDDWMRAAEFAKSQNLGYPVLFDDKNDVAGAFRIQELPTLVLIDRDGIVKAVRSRMVREDELEQMVNSAL